MLKKIFSLDLVDEGMYTHVLHVQKEFRDLHAILEINRFLLKVPFWPK